jgi:hypothetical protein
VATFSSPGSGITVKASYLVDSRFDYWIEYKNQLESQLDWQPLPNGPHNSGTVMLPTDAPQRFFRIRLVLR